MSPFSFLKKKKAKVSLCWNTKWVWLSPIDCELLQDNLEITQNTNITLLRFYRVKPCLLLLFCIEKFFCIELTVLWVRDNII